MPHQATQLAYVLVRTGLAESDVRPRLKELIDQIFRDVPCGTGGAGFVKIDREGLNRLLVEGARWMVRAWDVVAGSGVR